MKKSLRAKLSVRLFTDEKCFGPGIAALLRQIDTQHSLRAAAASMKMAYSKAWSILKDCETHLGLKLVVSTVGGKNGGGAILTDEAKAMLSAYDATCSALNDCAEALIKENFSFLHERKNGEAQSE